MSRQDPLRYMVLAVAMLAGCVIPTPPASDDTWLPRSVADDAQTIAAVADVDAEAVRRLQLISTNFVSALAQLPEMDPGTLTLQLSRPSTPFGLALVRALEDAGYGLQRVSADQGLNYLSYRRRVAQTDAGEVIDYGLSIGRISLDREYVERDGRVFPASLLTVSGTSAADSIVVDDEIFREQGGEVAFVSGIRDDSGTASQSTIREVAVADYEEVPLGRRVATSEYLERARGSGAAIRDERSLTGHDRLRRTVLIFNDSSTSLMGRGNKQAVRLLVRDFQPNDVFVITACIDADGRNEEARTRGLRVRDEFLSHGLPAESVQLAPCVRASYRHASDDSPVPVEVVQHRLREASRGIYR